MSDHTIDLGVEPAPSIPIFDIPAQLQTMKSEIDALQIAVLAGKKIWYKDVSTLVAALALLFSFGTTIVSYFRTRSQDVQASRQELRAILQRLNAIPRENLDASKRYAPDQNAIHEVDQLYAQETTMLSRQAAEIAEKMPKGLVSATEYYEIAIGLQSSYNLNGAREFLGYARRSATNMNDEIGAMRSSANLDFLTGQPNAGRQEYRDALDIFSKYPGFDQYTMVSTNIGTELGWAMSEAFIGQFGLGLQHLDEAASLSAGLPVSPGSEAMRAQIAQERQIILAGNSGKPQATASPVTPSVPVLQH